MSAIHGRKSDVSTLRHRYVMALGAFVTVLLLASAGLNAWVDPWLAYLGSPEDRFAAQRRYGLAGKAGLAERIDSPVILLGSSRTETGLDPEHPALLEHHGHPGINLGLPGCNMLQTRLVFDRARQVGRPRAVYLCIDFHQFVVEPHTLDDLRVPGRDLAGWMDSPFNPEYAALAFHAGNLFSFEPTLQVLQLNLRGRRSEMTPRGLLLRKQSRGARQSFASLFGSKLVRSLRAQHRIQTSLESDFAHILEVCDRDQISIVVLIQPVHALYLVMLDRYDAWDEFEEWKRRLVGVVESTKSTDVPLWDFTGFDEYQREMLPTDDAGMQYFYEASHYKPRLGDLVLWKLHGRDEVESRDLSGFGARLTSSMIEDHLNAQREDLRRFVESQPEQIDWLTEILESTTNNLQPQS